MVEFPAPETLAALQAESRFEKLGQWLVESGPEAATNPVNFAIGGAGLVVTAGTAAAIRAAVPALYYKAHYGLTATEGSICWGYRNQNFWDGIGRLPIPATWEDREMGTQIIAPTRQGKTTALLPIIDQDLRAGRDALIVEVSGDLGTDAEALARAMGAGVLKADASDPGSYAFNPTAAPTNEAAAQRASAAIRAITTTDPHYSSMNDTFSRHFTILARDYMVHLGYEANDAGLDLVRRFPIEHDYLKYVLNAEEGEDGYLTIDAPWLSGRTAKWLEGTYLRWTDQYRQNTISGFCAYLDNLLSTEAAEEFLCPEPGAPKLDLAQEVSEEAGHAKAPGELGRLIVIRLPIETLFPNPAKAAAYWVLKTVTDSTLTFRSKKSAPLAVYLDELPTLVGKSTHEALEDFQLWITNIAKFHVAVCVAYQGWDLLPEILTGTLQSNGRNVLISGGMRDRDAQHAQQLLGTEYQEVKDERTDLGRHSRSVGTRTIEKPRYSIEEIQRIPRGNWWLMRFHRGDYRKPVVIRVPLMQIPEHSSPPEPPPEANQSSDGPSGPDGGPAAGEPASGSSDGAAPAGTARKPLLTREQRRKSAKSGAKGSSEGGAQDGQEHREPLINREGG